MNRALLFAGLLFALDELSAQSDQIVTDRPDQTESAQVVGNGVLQIETGLLYERVKVPAGFQGFGFLHAYDLATTLVRYGIGSKVEARLATAYSLVQSDIYGLHEPKGLQALTIGSKVELFEEKAFRPRAALLAHLTLPWVGQEAFRPSDIAPDIRLSLSNSLSDRISLGYNIGLVWDGEGWKRFIYTLSVGHALSESVSGFVEIFGTRESADTWGHALDAGVTILLNNHLQLDGSAGISLSSSSKYYFINAGVSFRFGAN